MILARILWLLGLARRPPPAPPPTGLTDGMLARFSQRPEPYGWSQDDDGDEPRARPRQARAR
jgi:hypothetical protein